MRYLFLFLFLFVLDANAQKTFSLKDFNKLKQLEGPWLVHSSAEPPMYEEWQSINDSLLNGTWYRVVDDTNYLPEANIKLYYADYKIALECTFTGKNEEGKATASFELESKDKNIYLFTNIADTLSGEAKSQLKEILLITIAYDCSKKDRITAQRQYIIPGKGLQTFRYGFKKD